MIRMAQIGTDHMHAAAYRETLALFPERIEVVGLVRGARGLTPAELGPFADVPVFDSIGQLLNAVQVDAAQVMLPNHQMGAALATLAGQGIHLWAEKPVARRAADLVPVADLVRKKGLAFTAGYQARFQPTTTYARQLVREGLLGPLTFAHMTTTTTTIKLRDPDGPYGHLFDDAVSGGGIFHWLGCHMLDLLLTITGGVPEAVQAMTATVGEADVRVEDIGAVTLRFRDGWLASLNYGYLLPTAAPSPFGNDEPQPGIYGQQGWVRWNNHTQVVTSFSQHPAMAEAPWQKHDLVSPNLGGYGRAAYLAMTNFLDAIDGLAAPVYTVEQAMLVLHLIEAIYAAAAKGRAVEVDPTLATAYITTRSGDGR
jgi:predicted dehydrogenase